MDASRGEVRVTDPNTGGQKGSKIQRFSLIPSEFVWALAGHYGVGARKYEDRNWERGYKWSLSYDALMRHLNQWLQGEDQDIETGTHHLICVAWHVCALFIFQFRKLGTDDLRTGAHIERTYATIGSTPVGACASIERYWDDSHESYGSVSEQRGLYWYKDQYYRDGKPACNHKFNIGDRTTYVCTLTAGHLGKHIATDVGRCEQ